MRRKIEDAIAEWDKSGRSTALMIRGARQVGKTYSVEKYCELKRKHVLSIDLSKDKASCGAFDGDLTVEKIIFRLSAIHREFEFIPGRTVIFLDEIQSCPNARTALKTFASDKKKRYKVIASGSLLGLKLNEVGLPPTGYVDNVEMGPMDFEEFLWALGVPEGAIEIVKTSIASCEPIDSSLFDTFSEYYRWYLVVGGMPEVVREFVQTKQMGPVRRTQKKIVDGYMEDFENHADEDIKLEVESCFRSIPAMLAAENKRFKFNEIDETGDEPDEPDTSTVVEEDDATDGYYKGYDHYAKPLAWLSMARLSLTCRKVSEMHMPLQERIKGNMFKLYMLDTGILISLYEAELAEEVLAGNVYVNSGALTENAIAVALSLQGRSLYYYKNNKTKAEIDFVLVVDGRVCAVEVKSGSNRSCSSLNKVIKDEKLGAIMLETRNCFIDDKGVKHYPLFAASFMNCIDHHRPKELDFESIAKLQEMYGGGSGTGAERRQGTLPS